MKEYLGETIGSPFTANVKGIVRVVKNVKDLDKIRPHEIIVMNRMQPSEAPYVFKSKGVIVEEGTRLQHASILARELGIPCIALKGAVDFLKDGNTIMLDSKMGRIVVYD